MRDMQTHLKKLRQQLAECERIRDLATDPVKRDLFATIVEHYELLAEQIERVMAGRAASDIFLGRKTYDPFPHEEQ